MTVLGVAMIAAAVVAGAGPTIGLIGMMLVVAGIVKIVIVRLWNGVAGFAAPVESASASHPSKE